MLLIVTQKPNDYTKECMFFFVTGRLISLYLYSFWKRFSLFLTLEINALSKYLHYKTNSDRSLMKSKSVFIKLLFWLLKS